MKKEFKGTKNFKSKINLEQIYELFGSSFVEDEQPDDFEDLEEEDFNFYIDAEANIYQEIYDNQIIEVEYPGGNKFTTDTEKLMGNSISVPEFISGYIYFVPKDSNIQAYRRSVIQNDENDWNDSGIYKEFETWD